MYRHDIESYIITIRRKGGAQVAETPLAQTEAFKPAQPVHKIEKPVKKVQTPIAEASSVRVPSDGAQVSAGKTVKSPLPGVIIAVKVKVGDKVKTGDVVAVLEAMKMENEIQSEYDGTVTSVNVAPGDSILEGTLLVTL